MLCFGYEFVPTEDEFLSWPSYCQAKYVTTPIGETTPFAMKVSRNQIAEARRQIGEGAFLGVHHTCAGNVWLKRAKYQSDKTQRKFMYNQVIGEISFAMARMPLESPLITGMFINLATATDALGDPDAAIGYLNQAIDTHPEMPAGYTALGLFYRKSGDLKMAKEAFVRGNTATNNSSAELNYNLALILLELKDNDGALVHAKRAYESGYPLPGLRNKLIKLGIWNAATAKTN